MAEMKTYKSTGKYPNEGINFKNGIRIQFKAFHYSTENPIEIATIESSSQFASGGIIRVQKKEIPKTGPETAGQVTTQTGFTQDPGERLAIEKEKEALAKERAEIEQMKKELQEASAGMEPGADTPSNQGTEPEKDPGKGSKKKG